MKVLYYYHYLFFKNVLHDDDAHFTTILSLGADLGFILTNCVAAIMQYLYCYEITMIQWATIFFSVGILVFFFYRKKGEAIAMAAPKLLNSRSLSIAFASGFFLFAFSSLIVGAILGKIFYERCH